MGLLGEIAKDLMPNTTKIVEEAAKQIKGDSKDGKKEERRD